MARNVSQTFYVDKSIVQNAAEVMITAIDLYFKRKPNETNNGSGITAPGVTIQLVPTANGVPVLDNINAVNTPQARCEYSEIDASSDASLPSQFRFLQPVPVRTNAEYAMVISYDGDEDFEVWTSKKGHYLIGTTQTSPGASGNYSGNYFEKITGATSLSSNNTNSLMASAATTNGAVATPNSSYTTVNWRPLSDTDMKYKIYVARYTINGNTVFPSNTTVYSPGGGGITIDNGVWTYRVPAMTMEYVIYDRKYSNPGTVMAGEKVYQNTVYYSHYKNSTPTPLSVVAGSQMATAPVGMDFNTLYGNTNNQEYIVIVSAASQPDGSGDQVAVRQIVSIHANNVLELDVAVPFTNSSALFFKSPVAHVEALDQIDHFGSIKDILVLAESNANDSVRFVNNTVLAVRVTANGSGYKNTDVLTVSGFENVASKVLGGYPAVGNVVTNPSGNIVSIALSNVGAGFVNTSAMTYQVTNSTGGVVSGGATFSANVGSYLKTELLGTDGHSGMFSNCEIINLGFGSMTPQLVVSNPTGTAFQAYHRFGYYEESASDTFNGKVYRAYPNTAVTESPLVNGVRKKIAMTNPPVMPSRSNEFYITYPNGAPSMALSNTVNHLPVDYGASNSSVIIFRTSSNNDFTQAAVGTFYTRLTFSEYIYNDDYTGENTNQGNAWAKEISDVVNLEGDGAYAEDIVVYVTTHRPPNTDIKVFARIHNSTDPEPLDDKDWTLLENKSVANIYSSPIDEDDMLEMTFGFQAAPNTGSQLPGKVSTTLNSVTLTGSNTNFNSTLSTGDMVKVYQPLFPNNYMVTLVNTVASATSLTLAEPVANAGLVGSGLKIEKIDYKLQAFNNKLNQNVVRYYTRGGAAVDGYDTMQFKVVFLSSNTLVYPIVDDIRAVAVSA
jgi:hypothetical protein